MNPDSNYDGQARITAMKERVEQVLAEAAETDHLLGTALRDAVGHDPHSFTGVEYSGLHAAEQAHADSGRLLELSERPALSDDELREFNKLAEKYAQDPAFAERVALGMGAEGVAAFWLTTSSVGAIGDERHELVAATQEHVGHLLGLASHSSSDEMNSAPHNPGLKTKPLRTAQS